MNDAHLKLLKAYVTTRDAEAFASIADAYRDLVYSVCLRLLGNPADAEDVTQACFLTLARRAGDVRSSVAGWLHARATAMALTHLTRERNRRSREREYTSRRPEESAESNWELIAPEVDPALLELPEELREILIAHFLQRKAQVSIAEETGLSTPTVCRRIKAGIEALRSRLAARGVVASVAVLEVTLQDHALSQAPSTLATSLGKLAMAGIGRQSTLHGGASFALIGAITLAVIVAGVALMMHQAAPAGNAGGPTAVNKPTSTVTVTPAKKVQPMNDAPPIQTTRLVVRRFSPDDWKELQQLAIDKKNTGGDRYDHAWPTDDKGAQEMARWCVGERCFAVCLKDGGKLVGFVRFNSIDDKGRLNLGHLFHSRYRADRYASEAMRPLLEVAFADPKVNGIVACNAVDWPGQLTPLIELGFREQDRIQAPNFNGPEGGPVGFVACLMGLTRAEWKAPKPF